MSDRRGSSPSTTMGSVFGNINNNNNNNYNNNANMNINNSATVLASAPSVVSSNSLIPNNNNNGENTTIAANRVLLAEMYTSTYPSADELLLLGLDQFEESEVTEMMEELKNEVRCLNEETNMLSASAQELKRQQQQGGGNVKGLSAGAAMALQAAGAGDDNGNNNNNFGGGGVSPTKLRGGSNNYNNNNNAGGGSVSFTAAGPEGGGSGGNNNNNNNNNNRRGQNYRRKSLGEEDVYVHLSDKMALLTQQSQLLQQGDVARQRKEEEYKSVLLATVEEANKRMRELRLEVQQFLREVVNDDANDQDDDGNDNARGQRAAVATAAATSTAAKAKGKSKSKNTSADDAEMPQVSAEELQHYMERRFKAQENYYDKLLTQTAMEEKKITSTQQQARQRQAAGSSFQAVDFDQLHIENEQLAERMEKKMSELAALKSISTRTVQALNTLTNDLNTLMTDQARLKKDSKSRNEYLQKCQGEITVVTQEAARTEKKFQTIRAQQEAMEVPKIEEYIAQKAELYELEKAVKNWERKVDIAEGQVKVLKQQTKQLTKEQNAALDYATRRKNKNTSNNKNGNTNNNNNNTNNKNANNNNLLSVGGVASAPRGAGGSTVVGSTKSLLDHKRQTPPPSS